MFKKVEFAKLLMAILCVGLLFMAFKLLTQIVYFLSAIFINSIPFILVGLVVYYGYKAFFCKLL